MTELERLLREILAEVRNINTYLQQGQMSLNLDSISSRPELDVPQVNLKNVKGLFDDLESPDFKDECKPPEPPATREDVIAALNKVAKKHGPEAGKRILTQCGVAKLAELPEDKYRLVIDTCEALQ